MRFDARGMGGWVQGARRSPTALLGLLSLTAGLVSYGSNVIFSRLLSPTGFGDLVALLALAVMLAVPAGAAQTVVAQRVARLSEAGNVSGLRYYLRHALAHITVVAVVVGVVYLAFIPLVAEGFALSAWGPAAALAPLLTASFIYSIVGGALQGREQFVLLGVAGLAIVVARVGFGVPWAWAGGGAGGAIGGQAIGMFVVVIVALWLMRPLIAGRGLGAATTGAKRLPTLHAVSTSLGFIAFATLSSLDVILAKLFLDPVEAGLYAALSILAKVIIFLPSAIAQIVVPRAARAEASPVARQAVLRRAAWPIAVVTVAIAVPLIVAPTFWIKTVFGVAYASASNGVLPSALAGVFLSFLILILMYSVAIRDGRWPLVLGAGIVVQAVGISLFHGSVAQVAWVQAAATGLALVLSETAFHPIVIRRMR